MCNKTECHLYTNITHLCLRKMSQWTETGKEDSENGQMEKWRDKKEYKFIFKNNVMWVM